jgi:hypothetical protein
MGSRKNGIWQKEKSAIKENKASEEKYKNQIPPATLQFVKNISRHPVGNSN